MKQNAVMVILVLVTFFVISFLTNVLGPLIPDIIDNFSLSLGLAGFLPFSFFVAYGVMSIPAGILVEKYTEKPVLIAAFVLAFMGALLFVLFPKFGIALLSLFLIGRLAKLVPENLKWVSLYWVFTLIILAMIVFIWLLRFPRVELRDDEK